MFFEHSYPLRRVLAGKIEHIGSPKACFCVEGLRTADNFSRLVSVQDYSQAAVFLIDWLEKTITSDSLIAVGHRMVHGGSKYYEAQEITTPMAEEPRPYVEY